MKRCSHPTEERISSDDERDEELIPNQGLVFKAMLRSALPSKKKLKEAHSRETELWHTARADA